MRVLHVVAAGEIGGAERMLLDLVRGQPEHSVALFSPSQALRELLRGEGIALDDRGPLSEGPLSFVRRALGAADVAWLRQIARARRAQVLHLHTFASQVLGTRAALAEALPVLRTEHSTRVYDDPSCRPFSRWSLQRVSAVAYVSEYVQRLAERRADLPGAAAWRGVIRNGVDTEHFAAQPRPPRSGRLRLLHLGRLDPRKGIDRALRALAQLPGAELTLVGSGGEEAALRRQAAALGISERVLFAGYQADVRPAIAACDAVVSCARTEGLGLALLEAMACARPVVALPTGGVPEIVHDGLSGWLCREQDEAQLLDALREAAASPEERERRGVQARAWVLQHASAQAMRERYAERYQALITRA